MSLTWGPFHFRHTWVKYLAVLLFFISSLLFLLFSFQMEGLIEGGVTYKYIWHNIPLALLIILLVTETIFFFALLRHSRITIPANLFYLWYMGLTILIGYTFYTPDIFGRMIRADSAHGHAYYNSIYNVFCSAPYTETTTSIYGHYALFFKLPLKIMGGHFTDFILLCALIGAFSFLCMFLALHLLVKNPTLRILGSLAMTLPILSMRGGYYWQVWPHRIIFMSIMLLLGAFYLNQKKKHPTSKRLTYIICPAGYIISCLAILWNTESGLFCALGWASFWLIIHLTTTPFGLLAALKTAITHLTSCVISFFGAYALVNLYNTLLKAPANSIKEFLFPLLSSSYMTDLLMLDLPLFPSAYMIVIALLFIAIAWGLSCMTIFPKNQSSRQPKTQAPGTPSPQQVYPLPALPCYCFFLAIITLGQLTYFINRPAYHNLDIVHLPLILLLCILCTRGTPNLKTLTPKTLKTLPFPEIIKICFSALTLATLLTLSTGTLIQYSYNTDIKKDYHNTSELQQFANTIAAEVPPNTYAFGVSVPEIYSLLHWNTNCYTLDFVDMSLRPQVADYVLQDLQQKNPPAIFTAEEALPSLRKYASTDTTWLDQTYTPSKTFEYRGTTFIYHTRTTT